MVQFDKALGWDVTVCDRRIGDTDSNQFSLADKLLSLRPEKALNHLKLDSRTAAVLMSHHYFDDLETLRTLVPSAIGYLGLLGPKLRTQKLLRALETESIRTDHLKHLYAPVGLDIGAETPEAIALAILAEIQAVFANRSGGMLRDRKAPIYSRSSQQECLMLG